MSLELVESMMDLSLSMATLGARQFGTLMGGAASKQAMGAALRLLQQSAEVAHAALPGEMGREWRELANKLEAFEHFQQAPDRLGPAASLSEQLRRASALDAYRWIWTVEGLGYAWAESAWETGSEPRRLLSDTGLDDVPANVFIPLHTGAALSFAGRLLAAGETRAADFRRCLALWEQNARPGCGAIAAEALGLVVRNLYPHLVRRLEDSLAAIDPILAEYFWHGVGRGLYFAPTHALPYSGAHGRALEKAWREPADEPSRRNATAGLAWALTLVNLRDPGVLAEVLKCHVGEIGSVSAFANGVASAVLIWYDAVGLDSHLADFLAYRPSGSFLTDLWSDFVGRPSEEALRHTYPRLRQSGTLAALFRCQTPPREGLAGP